MDGWTYGRTVDDVMAIKQRFLASMGYHIFLKMVLRARAFGVHGAPLVYRPATFASHSPITMLFAREFLSPFGKTNCGRARY